MTTENMSVVKKKDTELKKSLEQLIACQKDIDNINKMTNNEIFNLEQKFEKLREPLYEKRNLAIKRLPNFWGTSFNNNPNLLEFMGKTGFRSIRTLEVENLENIKMGYRIHLHFYENPYFENKVLTKEIRLGNSKSGEWASSTSTPIKWKEGMQYTAWPSSSTKTMYKNFFDWFLDDENPNCDHIGDLIRDDLWINPLRYYCLKEKRELDDEQTEESDDEEDNKEEKEDNLNEQNDDNWNENDNINEEEEDN